MKKGIFVFLILLLLCFALPTLAETLATPELVSGPEGEITFYDPLPFEIKPVPNAEKYMLHVSNGSNEGYGLDQEFDTTVFTYEDWPEWSKDDTILVYITAEAEGYESSEPLVLEYEVKNCDDSIRPEPPEVTLSFSDEIVTNKSKVTITIPEDYKDFTISCGYWTSFPIEGNSYTTSASEYCRNGTASIKVQARKNGIWSLATEPISFTVTEADALIPPEFQILTEQIYPGEPVGVEILNSDERTEEIWVYIEKRNEKGRNVKTLAYGNSKKTDMEAETTGEEEEKNLIWIRAWRKQKDGVEPGEYTLCVVATSDKYNDGASEVPITVLEERPDEEKKTLKQVQEELGLITPAPESIKDGSDSD